MKNEKRKKKLAKINSEIANQMSFNDVKVNTPGFHFTPPRLCKILS